MSKNIHFIQVEVAEEMNIDWEEVYKEENIV